MNRKIKLLFETIRHLKATQLVYQVWFRLKNRKICISIYKAYDNENFKSLQLNCSKKLILSSCKLYTGNYFHFLNLSYRFKDGIDWNFMGHGKLWNYNLQYFDYILDKDGVSFKEQSDLVEDFSAKLLSGQIKLEPYPISLRIINWILFTSDTGFRSENFDKALVRQVDYLKNNLEFHIQANHLLENYIALCFSGLFLDNKKLIDKAFTGLYKQLNEQILIDGGHYECSAMYHSILFGRLLLLYEALLNENKSIFQKQLLARYLSKMNGWLHAITFRSGRWGHFNDATDDIAPIPAFLFNSAEQLGIPIGDITLSESGYRKLVTGNFEVFVDIGNIIPSYQPGHAHSDMLSFVLENDRKPLVTDTGISTYENNETRWFQRSTIAHNTIAINEQNQSVMWGSFRVGNRAQISVHTDHANCVQASHDGYLERFGIIHTRSFEVMKDGAIHIKDTIRRSKPKNISSVRSYIHFHHSIEPVLINKEQYYVVIAGSVIFQFYGADTIQLGEYEQAVAYNKIKKAKVITAEFDHILSVKISAN